MSGILSGLAWSLLLCSGFDKRHEISNRYTKDRSQLEHGLHRGAVAAKLKQGDVVALQPGVEGEHLLRQQTSLS